MKELSDLTAPVVVVKEMLEADLQKQCAEWYRRRSPGAWARKFSSISQRSVPDYLFSRTMLGKRVKFACEFKRPGCPINKETGVMSTKAQVEEQEAMRLAGWFVFECDDFERFKQTVYAHEWEHTK
jgi:hypothetical protein